MVEKIFFHLFDLVAVSAHILHNTTSAKKVSLEIFYEKVAEGFLASAGTEIQVQGPDCQQHMLRWRELLSTHVACVQREASARPGKL